MPGPRCCVSRARRGSCVCAHNHTSWRDASPAEVRRFLDRCRGSSTKLLRAAYDALHQLTFGAWYGNPASWAAIGYGGPPKLR